MMAGASPFVLPQFQGSLYDLQRQQALANALMERSLTPQQVAPGAAVGPYQVQARMSPLAPISQLGQALLSAKMGGQAAQGLNDLGQQQWGSLTNMLGGGAGMQSPQPNPGSADASGTGADAATGNAGGNGGAAANVGGAAIPGNAAGTVGGNGGVAPLNPLGMNPGMAAMMMMQSPDKYWEAQAAAYKPADIVMQMRAAGIDPNSAFGHQVAQNLLAKNTAPDYASGRPGGYMLNKSTGQMEQLPQVPEGYQAIKGADNQWHIVPVEGGIGALRNSAAAGSIGRAYGNTQTAYQNGQPVFANSGALAEQTANGMQPGTAPASAGAVNAGRFQGYQAPGSAPLAPALTPGAEASANKFASDNAARAGQLTTLASDSPTRMNVLDNIIDLSKQGVQTGPGAEWQNKAIGYVANAPLLSQLPGMAKAQDNVAKFQELQKFLNQNGLRAWQAAGGSGTDAQLDAALHANPNDKMFPQALQTVAQWAKAGEVALQAKANAQNDWLGRNGNNPQAQNQFETAWRKNFDPRVYQMQLMAPGERASFLSKQPDAAGLRSKVQTALTNGWVQ